MARARKKPVKSAAETPASDTPTLIAEPIAEVLESLPLPEESCPSHVEPPASAVESPPASGHTNGEHAHENGEELRQRYNIAQPRGNYRIAVNEQGDKLRFLRHSRYYQDQICLETSSGERLELSDKAKDFLKERGWRERLEEKVMTRQLARASEDDPYARSKSDKQFQDDFVELAQAMRAESGLPRHEAYEGQSR